MHRTLQHQKLMAQSQDLSMQGSAGTQRAAKREKHEAENCRHGDATGYRVGPVRSIASIRTEFLLGTVGGAVLPYAL
jgi:hypothetical protein